MNKKEYLSQAKVLKRLIECNTRKINELNAMVDGIASPAYGDKVQTSRQSSAAFTKRVERIAELERLLAQENEEYVIKLLELNAVVADVPDYSERLCLKLRYIEGLRWEEVENEMHYSTRQMMRIHGSALEHVKIKEPAEASS